MRAEGQMRAAPHPTDIQVGRRLREQRTLKGMSQERLGRLIGVTYQQVQKYERGTNRIGSSRLDDIARILGVPVGFFFEAPGGGAYNGSERGVRTTVAGSPALTSAGEVDRRETLELVRAFNRIGDPQVRRRMLDLARALATLAWRNDRPHAGDA